MGDRRPPGRRGPRGARRWRRRATGRRRPSSSAARRRGAHRVARPLGTRGSGEGRTEPGPRAQQEEVHRLGERAAATSSARARQLGRGASDAGAVGHQDRASASGGSTKAQERGDRDRARTAARPDRATAARNGLLRRRAAVDPSGSGRGAGTALTTTSAAAAPSASATIVTPPAPRCGPSRARRPRRAPAPPARQAAPIGVVRRKPTTPGSIADTRTVNATGATVSTPADARAWVASARASPRSSRRSRRVAATRSRARPISPPARAPRRGR